MFHVNIITGSGVMKIPFYEWLTRNLVIGNTTVWALQLSVDWSELGVPNVEGTSVIKCYWMLQNARVTFFTCFWVIKWKPPRGMVKLHLPSTPRLGLIHFDLFLHLDNFLFYQFFSGLNSWVMFSLDMIIYFLIFFYIIN